MVWLTTLPDDWWNTYTSFLLDPSSIAVLTDEILFITRTLLIETRVYARVCKRICLIANDFHATLENRRIRHSEKFSNENRQKFISLSSIIEQTNRCIDFRQDKIKMSMHWLAIDGEQPIIPENPTSNFDEKNSIKIESIFDCQPKITSEMIKEQSPMIQKILNMSIMAKDQVRLKWSRRVDPLTMNNLSLKPLYPRQVSIRQNTNLSTSVSCLAHELSVEQQIYFQSLTETCFNGNEDERTNVFRSLSSDAALQPLLPRLVRFIHDGILMNIFLRDLLFVIRFLSMMKMLSINKHVAFEKSLASIFSCLLTCLSCVFDLPKVNGQLSTTEKTSTTNYSTIWILREQTSDLLVEFHDRYSKISDLTERIVPVLQTNLISNSMTKTYSIVYASLRTLIKITKTDEILSICSLNRKFDVDFDLEPLEQQKMFDEKIVEFLKKFRQNSN